MTHHQYTLTLSRSARNECNAIWYISDVLQAAFMQTSFITCDHFLHTLRDHTMATEAHAAGLLIKDA